MYINTNRFYECVTYIISLLGQSLVLLIAFLIIKIQLSTRYPILILHVYVLHKIEYVLHNMMSYVWRY